MQPAMPEHKVDYQVDHQLYNFCRFAQKHSNEMTDFVVTEPLLRHLQVNCLLSNKDNEPFTDHLCLFRALAMYMKGHSVLDSHNFRYSTEFLTL